MIDSGTCHIIQKKTYKLRHVPEGKDAYFRKALLILPMDREEKPGVLGNERVNFLAGAAVLS